MSRIICLDIPENKSNITTAGGIVLSTDGFP